ncbi:hypothetical protein [Caulobacter sp. 17J65-9]|uniref:hypothetical protein n=1 Tax=Caulobacter sp. 17J65-9 TaxID=2709382 RepID=UPI0013C7600C|nr:hypothetical protein [Caulobacter sp. 17J65-9]NEX93619.1 hypothetical protein [Caulobacter sp. 17J65-9]
MTQVHYDLILAAEKTAWLLAVAFALWRGDGPARWIAAIYLLGNAAMLGVMWVRPAEITVDIAGLVAMGAVAVRAPRPWVLWGTAFQLLSAATRVAAALDDRIQPLAYSTALNTWWMLQLAMLVWGTVETSRARPASEAAA